MAKKSKQARSLDPRPAAVPTPTPADLRLRGLIGRVTGARLCYGKPVSHGDVTIVPVASVQAAGGGGFGRGSGPDDDGSGGGGGGWISATPVGYIEIDPHGARFRRVVDPLALARALAALASAAALVRGARRLPRPSRGPLPVPAGRRRRRRRRRGLLLLR